MTGYVPPDVHDALADRFFAEPDVSAEGWERATDALRRLLRALDDVLSPTTVQDVLVVGHGGVGTLLWCSLTGRQIDRRHDQSGPGNVWAYDLATGAELHAWEALDG